MAPLSTPQIGLAGLLFPTARLVCTDFLLIDLDSLSTITLVSKRRIYSIFWISGKCKGNEVTNFWLTTVACVFFPNCTVSTFYFAISLFKNTDIFTIDAVQPWYQDRNYMHLSK